MESTNNKSRIVAQKNKKKKKLNENNYHGELIADPSKPIAVIEIDWKHTVPLPTIKSSVLTAFSNQGLDHACLFVRCIGIFSG